MSGEEPTLEELLDGLELWREHRPQSAEDWIGVAERCIADTTYDRSHSTVMFRALMLAVEQRDAARALAGLGGQASPAANRTIEDGQENQA